MSNRRKVDLRNSLHICPFCRTCVVEVPAWWEWPSEVEALMHEHIQECLGGIVEVRFS